MRALGAGTPQMETKLRDSFYNMPVVEIIFLIILILASLVCAFILLWWYTIDNKPGDTTTVHRYSDLN